MAATQTEIIAERRKEKKRAEARGEGDMVEGYDPVVPPPPNVAPPLPPETEGYDPVVDPPLAPPVVVTVYPLPVVAVASTEPVTVVFTVSISSN